MKTIRKFNWHHGTGFCKDCRYSEEAVKDEVISQINIWLKRNPEIKIEDINHVGILESGEIQFKIPYSIKDRQVIILIAWLKWFYNLNDLEVKNGKSR